MYPPLIKKKMEEKQYVEKAWVWGNGCGMEGINEGKKGDIFFKLKIKSE